MNGRPDPTAHVGVTRLSRAELARVIRSHQAFLQRKPGGQRALLQFHDLSSLDLSGYDLSEADLTGCVFRHARLDDTQLRGANLFGSDLRMTGLRRANLTRADLRGASLRGADLTDALVYDADIREAQLAHYDKSGNPRATEFEALPAELSGVTARGADFSRAQLGHSMALQTDFSDARLRNTNFRNADLRRSVLTGAAMEGADLGSADLSECQLTGAVLTDANVRGARFNKTDVRGAVMDDSASEAEELIEAIKPPALSAVCADLEAVLEAHAQWVNSSAAEGARANLADADLRDFRRPGVNLAAAVMERAVLKDGVLLAAEMPMIQLAFADLRGAQLAQANMRGADLQRAVLTGADLRDTRLGPVRNVGTGGHICPANLAHAKLAEAQLAFLGLGDAGISSWGQLIAAGRSDLAFAPWIVLTPGIVLFLTILAFNFLGDALLDAIDPAATTEAER